MKRSKARFGTLGTVSHGTMRAEDLIPAFLDVAEGLRLTKADRAEVNQIRARIDHAVNGESEDGGPLGDDYFEGDGATCAQEDVTVLFDLLERYAPPFCYFGAIEGDGSDYGFWPSMDSLEESVYAGETLRESSNGMKTFFMCGGHNSEMSRDDVGKAWRYRMVVSDHGNVSLYYRNGREVWGIV